jgi:hypothetical protein
MRSVLLGSVLLVGCGAAEVQSQKLKDGSWSFQCELAMDECIRRVQDNCPNQRYRILDGTSETRLRDVPPFEHAYQTSRLHLACSNDGASPLLSLSSKPGEEDGVRHGALCTTGETRECVGPGACRGGQACQRDGSGFGACDCGPGTPNPASTSGDQVAPPPVSPEAATPVPSGTTSAAPAPAPAVVAPRTP